MNNTLALLMTGKDGKPLFATPRVVYNFALLVMCSQFAFAVLAMKGAFLPQLLELWQISKTQFGLLMSIYGICHNILYVGLSWAQDRFAPRLLISANLVMGGITTFFLGQTSDFATLCFLFVMLALWCEGAFWPAVIASVRKSTSDSNQAKIFGLLEGGRGCVELAQNALTVALYAAHTLGLGKGGVSIEKLRASDAALEVETPLMEAGVDSLAATELSSRLRSLTGVPLSPTIVFEQPTPRAVSSHLLEQVTGVDGGTTAVAAAMIARSSGSRTL